MRKGRRKTHEMTAKGSMWIVQEDLLWAGQILSRVITINEGILDTKVFSNMDYLIELKLENTFIHTLSET